MFTTKLVIQASFTLSNISTTMFFFNFKQIFIFILGAYFAPDLGAAKSVSPKLAIRDSHIVWWLYYYAEHGM